MRVMILAVALVLGSCGALAQGVISPERGLQISIIGGCHDCHTQGYSESEGKIDSAKALRGTSVGFRGPWGTTYPSNLLAVVQLVSEKGFVIAMKHLRTQPPMPWYNVVAMDESDLRSLYQYIKSLGKPGDLAPESIGSDVEPKTPYIQMAPPQMPKAN